MGSPEISSEVNEMRFTARWPVDSEASMMTFGYGLSVGESSVYFSCSFSPCLSLVERDTRENSPEDVGESGVEGGDRDAISSPPSPFISEKDEL